MSSCENITCVAGMTHLGINILFYNVIEMKCNEVGMSDGNWSKGFTHCSDILRLQIV